MSGRLGRTVDQQFLEQLLARTQSRFANLDIAIRIALVADGQSRQPDHGLCQRDDPDGLPHLEQENLARPRHRTSLDHQLRSEEHTSELQSLMRISYAVFCLKKKIQSRIATHITRHTK